MFNTRKKVYRYAVTLKNTSNLLHFYKNTEQLDGKPASSFLFMPNANVIFTRISS